MTGVRTDLMEAHNTAWGGLAIVPEGRRTIPNLSVGENLIVARGSGKVFAIVT